MTPNSNAVEQQAFLRAFRMPSAATPVSRKSSITNAFVGALLPAIEPTWQEIAEALRILQLDPHELHCVYCGSRSTEWDHLRPLVLDRRPTGFVSEIANLVPSCNKCNQSKGNKDWRTWMLSKAKWSPTGRGHTDVDERIQRLEEFMKWRIPIRIDFEEIIGESAWQEYWDSCEQVIERMAICQQEADRIKEKAAASVPRPSDRS